MSAAVAVLDGIDALVRIAGELPSKPQVYDGPEAQWPEARFLAVGLSPVDLEQPTTHTPRGPQTTAQSGDVTCLIRVTTGESDHRPARAAARALLAEFEAEIERDRSLGGAVGQAEITSVIYAPMPGRRGRLVDLIVTVQVINF